jgi:hypothetical protein
MSLNTAEGGTHGVTPTTSNTGGDSGDPASTVTIAAGDTITFSTSAAKYGLLGYRMTWLAAGAGATRFGFSHASPNRIGHPRSHDGPHSGAHRGLRHDPLD